jgi:hypothetical protein
MSSKASELKEIQKRERKRNRLFLFTLPQSGRSCFWRGGRDDQLFWEMYLGGMLEPRNTGVSVGSIVPKVFGTWCQYPNFKSPHVRIFQALPRPGNWCESGISVSWSYGIAAVRHSIPRTRYARRNYLGQPLRVNQDHILWNSTLRVPLSFCF